jgi:hypothetical protein
LLSFFWMAGLYLLTASRLVASSGTFQAFGYVLDEQGNPIVGVDVIGDDYVGDLFVFQTDTTGRYSVDFGNDGGYKVYVRCSHLNARGFSCTPEVPITVSDAAINIDFTVYPMPLQVTNNSLPKATIGVPYSIQLVAAGGQAPYNFDLADGSAALPEGFALSSAGLISGMPTTHTNVDLTLRLTDFNSATTNKTLSLVVNPRPTLTGLGWTTNRFSMLLTGVSNQNYTLQGSSNLVNWSQVLITNNKTVNSFLVADPKATNKQRLYRVLVGP